MNYSDTLKQKP